MKVKLKIPTVFIFTMLKSEYVKFDDSPRSSVVRRAVDEIIAGTGRFRGSPHMQINSNEDYGTEARHSELPGALASSSICLVIIC